LADYQVGIRHQLSIDAPVDDDGRLAHTSSMPGEMVGKSVLERNGRSEANDAVLHALRQRRAIAHQEDYRHRTPFCRYSRTPVIHRATAQWFLRLDHLVLRTRALEAIRRIQWLQEPARARAEDELRGWPDWCLSRQRAWGLPLPAFFTAEGNPLLDASVVRRLADLVEVEGPNVWFEKPAAELWTAVRPANWQGLEPVTRSPDTLDVRFDSRCVLSLPTRGPGPQATPAPIPIDLYVTSSDPLESWVLSTLLLSLTASETAPLRSVLACSPPAELTRRLGARGQPSRCGPAASPLAEEVRTCGADVVRWWAVSQGCHTGIRKSQAQPQAAGATYRSIRNALRFQLSNLYDFDPAQHALPVADLTRLDRWLLEAFSQLEETVLEAYDRCDLPAVCQQLSHFIADQLSATYFDIIKDRLYTESPQSFRRRSTQTALCRLLTGLCQMLAPVLVFTADEAWELIPGCSGKSVHESDWKPSHFARPEPERAEWENLLALRRLALPVLEQSRRNRQIGKALNAKVTFQGGDPVLITGQARAEELRELLKVSQLEFLPAACPAISVTISPASGHKCERCWHWTEDVGRAPDHPGLCARCVGLAGILP
jgi:isoleucyl-tRNA synthetase